MAEIVSREALWTAVASSHRFPHPYFKPEWWTSEKRWLRPPQSKALRAKLRRSRR